MRFLNDAKEFGEKDDEETDGYNSGDDEFLSFTQLHNVRIIQSIVIEYIQLCWFMKSYSLAVSWDLRPSKKYNWLASSFYRRSRIILTRPACRTSKKKSKRIIIRIRNRHDFSRVEAS
jgi:hypothetical protein